MYKRQVVHWQQNAEDNGYVVADTDSVTGITGEGASYTEKIYTGFEFKEAENKTIAPDGTTVVNVYYDRKVYTFTMEQRTGGSWQTIYSVPYKYGQSTAPTYNAAVASNPNYSWYVSRDSNTSYSEAPAMPNRDLTVHGRYAGNYEYVIHYVEKDTNIKIKDDYVFFGSYYLTFTEEDGIDIPGFTVRRLSEWLPLGNDRIGTIYYDRNKYDITFNYNDGIRMVTRPNIPYEASISAQAPNDMIPRCV